MPRSDKPQENALENAVNRLDARAAMRIDKIAAREALAPGDRALRSDALEAHLAKLLARLRPRVLGFCWPIRGEFDCRPVAAQWIAQATQACLPMVTEPDAAMVFREWRPDSAMLIDRYGIHYPATGAALIPDVLLMPVNAFDGQGFRLGYGGGYFDRTLVALTPRPLAIGLGYELARVGSTQPGPHDIALDAVVTEAGLELFSGRLSESPGEGHSS
jgi:5-formyltetrahydrofolate cyclo-ligase